jgi:hypothetical protein
MIIFRSQKLRNAILECKIRISSFLMNPNIVRFKIGKTADPIEKRFKETEEYKKDYDDIILIYETQDKALVDSLEKCLIHDYRMTYPTKCKNKQEGSGLDCADSEDDTARIYIVVKYM